MAVRGIDLVSSHRIGSGLGDVAKLGRHGVREALSQDISLGDRVRSGGSNGVAAGNVLEHGLFKRDAFLFLKRDGLGALVDVGSGNRERHHIAETILALFVALGNHQIVINRRRVVRVGAIRDGKGAEHRSDGVVVGLGALVQGVGERVLRAADQRLGASHVVARAFAVHEAVATHGDRVVGQRRCIVDLLVGRGGQGDRALGDGEGVALDGHGVVGVGRSVGGHGDVVIGHVLALGAAQAVDGRDTVLGDAGYRGGKRRVGGGVVVVHLGLRIGRDGDGSRVDGQLAVDLGHVGEVRGLVVAVGVLDDEAVVHDVLALVAHVGGRAGGRGLDGEALGQAARGDLLLAGTVAGERDAVVGLGVARGGEGHGRVVLCDGQRAVDVGDLVVGGHVGVAVLDNGAGGDVLLGADLGDGAGDGDGLDRVVALEAGRRDVLPTVVDERSAVIRLGVGVGRNRERNRGDRERAVGRGHGLVLVGIGELVGERVVVGSGVGHVLHRLDVGDGDRVARSLKRVGVGAVLSLRSSASLGILANTISNGVGGLGVLLAVVRPGIGTRGNGEDLGRLGDRQRAIGGGNAVVLGERALVQGVGERVLGAANRRPGSGHVVGRALAVDEAVASLGNRAVGKRGAVILLGVGRGGHGQRTRGDGELAVGHGHDLVLAGVGELIAKRVVVVSGVANVLHGSRIRDGNRVARGEREHRACGVCGRSLITKLDSVGGQRVLLAIVLPRLGARGDGDGLGVLGDGELSGHVGHGVVALGGLARGDDRTGRLLDVGDVLDAEGDSVVHGVFAKRTLDGRVVRGGLNYSGFSVVGLGHVLGGDGDGGRGDLQGALVGGRLVVRVGGAHGDGLLADVLDRRGGGGPLAVAHLVLDGGALGHAGHGAGGVVLGVVDALVAGGVDGEGAGLGDLEVSGHVGHGVVALGGLAGRHDGVGVGSHVLVGAGARAGDGVDDLEVVDDAGDLGLEGRVVSAVDLVGVLGGDGDGGRGDLQGALVGGRLVVRVGGAHGDGLLADVLDRRGGGGPLAVAHLVLDGGALGHAGHGAGGVVLGVVDALVAGGVDGEGAGLGDGQVSVSVRNLIVVGRGTNHSVRRNDCSSIGSSVCLLACKRDARQGVIALEAADGNIRIEVVGIGAFGTLLLTVVGIGLRLCCNGKGSLVDGQGARCIRNRVIVRNTRDCSLILGGQIILRALGNVSNRRSSTESSSDGIRIAAELTRNGIRTIQRSSVVGLAVGLRRNRQRQRVIDRDDVTVGRHRNRLPRVVAVNRKVLLLIGGNRSSGVIGTDGLLRRHVVSNLGRGALKVVVHGDGSLIKVEVDLQDGRSITGNLSGKNVVRVIARELICIARCSLVFIGCVDGRVRLRGPGIGCPQFFILLILTSGILEVVLNLVVDVLSLPHGKHSVVRQVLVGCHLRDFCATSNGVLTIRIS